MLDDSDEKPCIFFLAREVQLATKPAKALVKKKNGARPFGLIQTAATEGWRTRPWPFTPRTEPQPVTKPAKAREEEKGARPFGPVSTAAAEGWRTGPWPSTPRAGQAIYIGGPVAEETFGSGGASTALSGGASTPSGVRADDEEPVEKALMASWSVAVTSEDSTNLAIRMAPAESFPGEVREPLPGGASTPLSGGSSTPSAVRASPETAGPSPALVPAR